MAGLEERLSKLEKILHRLFCCDTNEFTGPQGPAGPMGPQGLQGPPGVDGLITFQNLNWMGEWTPCVIYDQFDAVSYLGSSYFMNCESSATYECETPDMNPTCWVLLANAGATGPQGPTGLAGNDGSNSGRWQYQGLLSIGLPGLNSFALDVNNLATNTSISINKITTSGNYYDWLSILNSLDYSGSSPAFLQIVEVGNNSIVGLYEITGANGFSGPPVNQSLNLSLNFIGGQSVPLTIGTQYTISWVLNGVASPSIPKTYGSIQALDITGAELIYDFNKVKSANKVACVYLPNTTQIGKEVVVYSTELDNVGFYIQSNSQLTFNAILGWYESTGFITTYGIDEGESYVFAYPRGNYKFTFLGNIAAGGKAFWNMEALPNTYPTSGTQENLLTSSVVLDNPRVTTTSTLLTSSSLNAIGGGFKEGEQIFAPNQPGGAKMFTKTSTGWVSSSLNIVP
jgi:hypothetical protein